MYLKQSTCFFHILALLICYKHAQSSCLLILYFRPQSHSLLTYALHRALYGWIASSEISHEFEKVWANPFAFVYIFALVTYAYHYLLKKSLNFKKATCKGVEHFHNTRHLCRRFRTDGIKAMSRGISGQTSDKICQYLKSRSNKLLNSN